MLIQRAAGGRSSQMRVLAARFRDRRVASAVRDRLLHVLRTDIGDVEVAPLGVPDHPEADATVLAATFPDSETAAVARLINEAGGEVVTLVDEAWTRPRSASASHPWNSGFGRERVH